VSRVILHVDDDPDIRLMVSTVLSKEGFEVISIQTLGDAVPMLDMRAFDLILLDVMIEEQDSGLIGYEMLYKRFPDVPVILMTSLGDMVRPYFADRGFDVRILEKPVSPDQLINTIHSCFVTAARK
jgi:DNA-binding NtrC family response regulator